MAKYELRIKAREMRAKGESVREIAKLLGVSKGTTSLWVRDIILSVEQYEDLKKRSIKGGELGRMRGSLVQKERRLELIEQYKRDGIIRLKDMSKESCFIAGIALYWAEGSKMKREVMICNSDPQLINIMIRWFQEFFDVEYQRFVAVIGINEVHREREKIVKNYWSNITKIPLTQFRKTSFKKTINKKVYDNFNEHYGTLSLKVSKGASIYYNILGLIEGLASQGSSTVEQSLHKATVVGS